MDGPLASHHIISCESEMYQGSMWNVDRFDVILLMN